MQYKVLTNTACQGWSDCWKDDGKPWRFDTEAEAQAEINDLISSMDYCACDYKIEPSPTFEDMANIPVEVMDYAKAKGLTAIMTGGGCDYVCLYINNGKQAVVSDRGDCSSPETLDSPCNIGIYDSDDWSEGWIHFEVETCRQAIDMLASSFSG